MHSVKSTSVTYIVALPQKTDAADSPTQNVSRNSRLMLNFQIPLKHLHMRMRCIMLHLSQVFFQYGRGRSGRPTPAEANARSNRSQVGGLRGTCSSGKTTGASQRADVATGVYTGVRANLGHIRPHVGIDRGVGVQRCM